MSDAGRAADIIAKMSMDDKVALACGDFAAVAHLGLPALSFTDGGNGVRVAGDATAAELEQVPEEEKEELSLFYQLKGIDAKTADEFVAMYVNDLTLDMGERGHRAVALLLGREPDYVGG